MGLWWILSVFLDVVCAGFLPSLPPIQPGGELPHCRACPGLANKVSIVRGGAVWPLQQEVHIQRLGAEVITMVIP